MSRYIPIALRKLVAERAGHCCEYCLIKEEDAFFAFEIDHIISLKHEGPTTPENLAYSCFACNNNKGSDIGSALLPDKIFIRLFNPRDDVWDDHFEMEDGVVIAKTDIGLATIKVLKINEMSRVIERQSLTS